MVRCRSYEVDVGTTAIGAGIGFGGVTATLMILGMEVTARQDSQKPAQRPCSAGWRSRRRNPGKPEGQILVRGELWRAKPHLERLVPWPPGERVKVLRADGLIAGSCSGSTDAIRVKTAGDSSRLLGMAGETPSQGPRFCC